MDGWLVAGGSESAFLGNTLVRLSFSQQAFGTLPFLFASFIVSFLLVKTTLPSGYGSESTFRLSLGDVCADTRGDRNRSFNSTLRGERICVC